MFFALPIPQHTHSVRYPYCNIAHADSKVPSGHPRSVHYTLDDSGCFHVLQSFDQTHHTGNHSVHFRLHPVHIVHFPAHPSGNSCDPTRYIHCQVHNALPDFFFIQFVNKIMIFCVTNMTISFFSLRSHIEMCTLTSLFMPMTMILNYNNVTFST